MLAKLQNTVCCEIGDPPVVFNSVAIFFAVMLFDCAWKQIGHLMFLPYDGRPSTKLFSKYHPFSQFNNFPIYTFVIQHSETAGLINLQKRKKNIIYH